MKTPVWHKTFQIQKSEERNETVPEGGNDTYTQVLTERRDKHDLWGHAEARLGAARGNHAAITSDKKGAGTSHPADVKGGQETTLRSFKHTNLTIWKKCINSEKSKPAQFIQQ